jgi:D-lyxose ketol-isomerase
MRRSEVNQAVKDALVVFEKHHWVLPPLPRWDVTDFGLGNFRQQGLILINLAEEPEYCEKLMFAYKGQVTPLHTHKKKKEDIIVRWGSISLELWEGHPESTPSGKEFLVSLNGNKVPFRSGETLTLHAGQRITLTPGIYHAFWPVSEECIIGEVSTANDDVNDNFFVNPDIGRFAEMEEDEIPLVPLVSDQK